LLTLAEGEHQEETARARDLQQQADAADVDTRCQLNRHSRQAQRRAGIQRRRPAFLVGFPRNALTRWRE
jgi:hypothetical protein